MHVLTKGVSTHRRTMVHTFFLAISDSVAMIAAFEIARWIRSQSDRQFSEPINGVRFFGLMVATVPLWLVIFAVCGLYAVRVDSGRFSEAGRVLGAVFGGVTLLIAFDYLSFDLAIFPSRSVPVLAFGIGIVLVSTGRQIVRRAMMNFFRRGRGLNNVILIGTGDVARRIAVQLAQPTSGYRLVGAVHKDRERDLLPAGVRVYPSLQHAIAANPEHSIDEVVQADFDVPRSEAVQQMAFANSNGISYRFVPDRFGVYAAASTMATINGVPVMEVRLTSLGGAGAFGKRIFDAVGAVLLLLAFSPVLAVLALLVKVSEPGGPIFYTQQRLGRNGKLIGVKKFRSMSWQYSTGPDRPFKSAPEAFIAMGRPDVIAEFQVAHKVLDDPRVSKLGNFMRKTSLDELPQLLNALRGDLSLVGPRPITEAELERYGEQAASFLALKPGITGLWQVYGRSSTTYEERVKLDIYYVENWSVGMDVSILARTLVTVTGRKGAA